MRDIDRYEAEYLADYGFERQMVRYRRKRVLACVAQYPHQRILEVGCGIEPLFEHVDDWQEYTIVEPGREFAAGARKRVPSGQAVTVHEMLLEDAREVLAGRNFDFVIVSSLLHEVGDPGRLLAAVRALCAEETVVHLNVPNATSLHNRLAVKMGMIPNVFARSALAERMQRTNTYDAAGLAARVEEAGFRVETSGSYFLKPFTHRQLQRMLDEGIIDERVLDALDHVSDDFPDAGAEIYVNVRKG